MTARLLRASWGMLSGRLIAAGLVALMSLAAGSALAAAPFKVEMVLYRGETDVERGFRDYLNDHKIAVDITVDNLDRDMSRLPATIAAIKSRKPDLVYTWGTGISSGVIGDYEKRSADVNITDIPVIFTMVTSPIESRLVKAMGPSESNFTGASHIAPLASQIRAMRVYRGVSRLAVIFNPTEPNSTGAVDQLRALCAAEKIELIAEPVPLDSTGKPRANTIPALVAKVAAREPQFLYIGPDTFIGDNRDVLTAEAIKHQVPVFTGTELEIKTSNAMVGLVTNYYALGKLAGFQAEQILVHKVPPGAIPVQTLSRFSYMVKMSVARALGLYPPMALLDYAEIEP